MKNAKQIIKVPNNYDLTDWFSLSYKTSLVQILSTFSNTYADCAKVLALIIFQQDLDRTQVLTEINVN